MPSTALSSTWRWRCLRAEDVDAWREWLVASGLEVITNDHGSIYSIYFRDPVNDIRLEITASITANWNAKETSARVALDEWIKTKREARAAGKDVTAALCELAAARSRSVSQREH